MIRGTTPTIILTVEEKDLTGCSFFISIMDKGTDIVHTWDSENEEVELHSASDEASVIYLTMTQEETLAFSTKKVEIQVRWIDHAGVAGATDIAVSEFLKILKDGEISYLEG